MKAIFKNGDYVNDGTCGIYLTCPAWKKEGPPKINVEADVMNMA